MTLKTFLLTVSMVAFVSLTAFALESPSGRKVLVVGHRGASGYAPENTMAAFKLAHEMGADMFELDVYMSADGQVVVMHDDDIKRTTNGEGPVEEKTAAELAALDAGSWYKEKFTGEPVPTLEQVLAWAKDKILVNIEIKGAGCEQPVVDLVKKYEMVDQVIVSSFHHDYLAKIKELEPAIETGALFGKERDLKEIIEECHPDAVNPKYILATKAFVKEAHALGLEVNVYTVNDQLSMKQMLQAGVDSIITNYPDTLIKMVDKKKKKKD